MPEPALAGRVVLVTRPEPRDGPLLEALRAHGAEAIAAPVIRIEPSRRSAFARAIRDASEGRFAWVVFTSAATVDAWEARAGGDASARPAARIAAIGPATERALRRLGLAPDLVPKTFTTAALGRAFPRGEGRVLLPRADIAPAELEAGLQAKGWTPVRVEAYRTKRARSLPAAARSALRTGAVDAITLTSASTAEAFAALAQAPPGARVVCIGPVTARAARAAGLPVHAVARPHTVEGLVAAVERALRRSAPARSGRVRASTRREAR